MRRLVHSKRVPAALALIWESGTEKRPLVLPQLCLARMSPLGRPWVRKEGPLLLDQAVNATSSRGVRTKRAYRRPARESRQALQAETRHRLLHYHPEVIVVGLALSPLAWQANNGKRRLLLQGGRLRYLHSTLLPAFPLIHTVLTDLELQRSTLTRPSAKKMLRNAMNAL